MAAKGTSSTSRPSGPHGQIPTSDARERFAAELFDRLWDRYRSRVEYVATYERVIAEAGATFVNDHIAFRTFACQQPMTGIASVSRIFEALGYQAAGCYRFPDKHLSAVHFQHANSKFPKIFISELQTWELDSASRETIAVRSPRWSSVSTMASPNRRRQSSMNAIGRSSQRAVWIAGAEVGPAGSALTSTGDATARLSPGRHLTASTQAGARPRLWKSGPLRCDTRCRPRHRS